MDYIYFGGGCFWCIEAVFQRVKGVVLVESGYTGGDTRTPNYDQVSTGTSGHAEVVKVGYDPSVIDLNILLDIFFTVHDPTTLNQQGADKGTQYRSAIFVSDTLQYDIVQKKIQSLTEKQIFAHPIVTEVKQLDNFYIAEGYHQNFYNQNQKYGYCEVVINPKLNKLRTSYSQYLNE
jgi:peptide-methionine (S)-S-oxide reductase